MTTIRRISQKEIRAAVSPGMEGVAPTGLPPVLKSSWGFARSTAQRFNRELLKDRVDDFLKKLAKRFTS
jgi:hypothetical protein